MNLGAKYLSAFGGFSPAILRPGSEPALNAVEGTGLLRGSRCGFTIGSFWGTFNWRRMSYEKDRSLGSADDTGNQAGG